MLFHSYVAHFSQIFYIMIISLLAFVPHEEEPFTIPNVFSARQFLIHDIHPQSNDTYFFLFLSLFYFILFFFGTFFSCVTFNEVNVSGPFFFFFLLHVRSWVIWFSWDEQGGKTLDMKRFGIREIGDRSFG